MVNFKNKTSNLLEISLECKSSLLDINDLRFRINRLQAQVGRSKESKFRWRFLGDFAFKSKYRAVPQTIGRLEHVIQLHLPGTYRRW